MNLWKHPKFGTYYIHVSRNRRISLKTKSKTLAQQIFRQYQKDLLAGKLIELDRSELLNDFVKSCLANYEAKSEPETFKRMKYSLNVFKDFIGNKQLSAITKRDMDRFVEHRLGQGLSKTTINIDIRSIKAAFGKAVEWEIIQKNNISGFKQLRIDKKAPIFLTMEDIKKVAEKIDEPIIKSAFFFYLLTGCRRDELINITWQDIDTASKKMHIRKTKTHLDRWIPINDSLMEIIKSMTPDKDKVNPIGKLFPMHSDTMTHKMKKVMRDAGFPDMKLHNLRHTFASLVAMEGASLQVIRDLLGHTDIRTTEIYAHLTSDYLKEAVKGIKLDAK